MSEVKGPYEVGQVWHNQYNSKTYVYNGEYWTELGLGQSSAKIDDPSTAHVVNPMVPEFYVSEPEFVGKMPVRKDIEVIPAEKRKKLTAGWVVSEIIGVSIVNPRAVAVARKSQEDRDEFWMGLEGRIK